MMVAPSSLMENIAQISELFLPGNVQDVEFDLFEVLFGAKVSLKILGDEVDGLRTVIKGIIYRTAPSIGWYVVMNFFFFFYGHKALNESYLAINLCRNH